MELSSINDQFPNDLETGISPQYGNQTLQALRQFLNQDVQQLFSRNIKGGIAGFYPTGSLPVYFITDQLLDELKYTYIEFTALFGNGMLESIHPEDREAYINTVKAALSSETGEFEHILRAFCKNSSGILWVRDIGKVSKDHHGQTILLILRTNITDMLEHNNELEYKALAYEEKSKELEALTANIPGGVCEVSLDDDYTLVYANDGFYKLFGYTREQMEKEHQNRLLDLIFDHDREYVKKVIEGACERNDQAFQFEHRIVKRDHSIIWILIRGNFSNYKKRSLFNCVVIDITDRKRIEDEARMSEKRFRIALAQTDNSIFEYDIRNHIMIHGDKSAAYFGLEQQTENVPDILLETGVVHSDTAKDFLNMYNSICRGEPAASCMIKARLVSGEYAWQKITMTTIFDENNNPVQAIGVLEDIDEQVKREESLRYRSERDALTGLYNRGAIVQRIEQQLSEHSIHQISALFIIDVDMFKQVNDNYGHMYGDFVLSESANRISGLFKKQEIIGRIGGDEFVVYMNLDSRYAAAEIAENMLIEFQHPFESRGISSSVSCSIGISIYPENGLTFEELYQHADIALYEAKKNGKNMSVAYEAHMAMTGEWSPYSNTSIDQ